jgi:hypothetical protein
MNRILKAYLKRLTNLSTRNKSLLLPGLPAEQFIDLHDLDFLLGKSSFEFVQQLIQRKSRIPLCDLQDPRFEKVNEVSKKLRKISRTERFIAEERGSQDLYVGYPFVRGKLADGTPIHAPLLFFPVTLELIREQWCLTERQDDTGISLNRSFSLAYAHFNEIVVTDELLEKNFEDFSRDPLEFRTQLYEWLKETPLRINFNPALFEDKLVPFEKMRSAELVQIEKNGELKLFPEAVLGIFPQASSYLVPDYNRLLEKAADKPFPMLLLKDDLWESGVDAEIGLIAPSLKEESMLTPFAVDESQEDIIRSVKSGQSVVVQGPPGSGKSQLICNLMADFASQGKRVLLVCQKRAALDVVYQRLKTIGMDPFVALIHDFKNDRQALYRQFASQIEQIEAYKKQNYGLDAVFLERQFTQESRLIDRTVESLEDFRSALFDDSACGISIKELYLTSDPQAPYLVLDDYRSFKPGYCEDFKRVLRVYFKYGVMIHPDHAWHSRKSFAAFALDDLRNMEKMLLDWPEALLLQSKRFEIFSGQSFSLSFVQDRALVQERIGDIASMLTSEAVYRLFSQYLMARSEAYQRLAFIRQTADALEGFMAEQGLEFSLDKHELSALRLQLKKALDAKQSPLSGLWWDWFNGDRKSVGNVALQNNLNTTPEHLLRLEQRVRNRMELESWLENELLRFDPVHLDQAISVEAQFVQFFQNAEKAADAAHRAVLKPWYAIFVYMVEASQNLTAFQAELSKLSSWLKTWDRMEDTMRPYLLAPQMEQLLIEPDTYSQQLLIALRRDFDAMTDMDQLWENMTTGEQKITGMISTYAETSPGASPDELVQLFENSVRLAWINHIEREYPDLRSVTSLKMQEWEGQLQKAIMKKQQLSSEIVGIKLRQRTFEDVANNRLGNRVTYRELNHQVTKKRRIWPIRKLLENHAEEAFSLVPCWMASPESVSAIFPMEAGLFDLVIFDEASQCYAEYGLPSAFRGKQVVVTGDSRQLAPSDLYRVRYDEKTEDDEIPVALEIESLLDLAAQTLGQHQLSGHYRSQSLDLIDFSNHYFYNDSLRLLPDFNTINTLEPGINYLKVDGVWKNNVNVVEVEKVIELLKQLSTSGKSVGVVTFNFYQQQMIQEAAERENVSANGLFVKNIENVQGDERDIIIFTMGYAPDERGRLSMQFGSLNMPGGENRLNVAVTRAREKIYFVTSLLPSQLHIEQTSNAGPKLLKAYLQYALDVSEGNYRPKPLPGAAFRTDWFLKDRLVELRPEYQKELPFGDITIKEEGVYKGLILTDDDLYHLSKSSKEPHAYLPLLLKLKNWPFNRVYSRAFWAGTIDLKDV